MPENASPHLLLVLDGPMHGWGYLSLFDRRNCHHFPTRSALVGMFCAAAGIDRADRDGLRRWDPLRLEVHAYPKLRARLRAQPDPHTRPAARPVSYRRWWDYHTVGGGYDEKTHRYFIPVNAEGKPRGTVVTHREYLADATFVVLVSAPEAPSLVHELCQHLCQPRWGIWLGRKCCVPAFPVCHKVHPSREEALARLRWVAQWRPLDLARPLRVVVEVDRFDDGTDTLLDFPLDFERRRFAPRRVCEHLQPPEHPSPPEGS